MSNKVAITEPVPEIGCGKSFKLPNQFFRCFLQELKVCGHQSSAGNILAVVMDLIPTKLESMSAVIHFITSFEEAKMYIGDLLAGRGPGDCPPNHVGSHDYSKHARCIFFGRGYTEEQVKEIHSLHRGKGSMALLLGSQVTRQLDLHRIPGPEDMGQHLQRCG